MRCLPLFRFSLATSGLMAGTQSEISRCQRSGKSAPVQMNYKPSTPAKPRDGAETCKAVSPVRLLGKLDQIRQKKPSTGTIHSPGRHACGAQEGDVQSRGKALRAAGCPEEGQHLLRTQVPHGRDCHESSFQRRTVQQQELRDLLAQPKSHPTQPSSSPSSSSRHQ